MSHLKLFLLSLLAMLSVAAFIILVAVTKATYDIYWFFHA